MSEQSAETKKKSPAAAVLNVIGTVIIVLAIILCLLPVLPRLLGFSGYTILSGSMEPTIPVGSVVYSKAVDNPETLEVGDIVVFYEGLGDIPVVHRLVENRLSERELITQGDANNTEDLQPIPYQNVIGKVRFHVPHLGTILTPLSTMGGKISVIALIIGGLLLCYVSQRLRT